MSEKNHSSIVFTVLYYVLATLTIVLGGLFIAIGFLNENLVIFQGLGISLIPSGLVQLLFGVVRHFDIKNTSESNIKIENGIDNLGKAMSKYLLKETEQGKALCEPVRALLRDTSNDAEINIDVMGLTLNSFFSEQLEYVAHESKLIKNKNCIIRMIVQDLNTENAKSIFWAEGLDLNGAKEKLKKIEEGIERLNQLKSKTMPRIELRYFNGVPTQTITRINDVIFCQVRNINPSQTETRFFEVYHRLLKKERFEYQMDFFKAAWEMSKSKMTDIKAGINDETKKLGN